MVSCKNEMGVKDPDKGVDQCSLKEELAADLDLFEEVDVVKGNKEECLSPLPVIQNGFDHLDDTLTPADLNVSEDLGTLDSQDLSPSDRVTSPKNTTGPTNNYLHLKDNNSLSAHFTASEHNSRGEECERTEDENFHCVDIVTPVPVSPLPVANLETIKEGEVLEIPETQIIGLNSQETENHQSAFQEDATDSYDPLEDATKTTSVRQLYKEDAEDEDDDDDESLVSIPAELPPPPDGGWGWVIVIISFLANMTVDGVAYSFSPFLVAFSSYFNEPKGKVAWISSLLAGVLLSVGPIVSALANKFGCRPVCMAGGLVASLAYASTIFATSVPYLMVTQGLVAGFGFGLIYLPAVVCVGYYFERKRALATGIAVCGSGVGTMVFPPLINLLIENFGWQGTNLIIAGIILNCCWMGALMRPLKVPRMRRKDLLQRLAEERKLALEEGSLCGSYYYDVTRSDGTIEKRVCPGKALNFDPGVHSHLSFSEYLTPVPTSVTLPTIQEGGSTPHSVTDQTSSNEGDRLDAHFQSDEKESLMDATAEQAPYIAVSSSNSKNLSKDTPFVKNGSPPKDIPRNSSQPSMDKGRHSFSKRASVPNFDRRSSRMELLNQLKVIPATPEASYTNLRSLGSQEMKPPTGRALSAGSFGRDAECGGLRNRRHSSKDRKGVMLAPLSRQDIFYSGSIRNLPEFRSQASMLSYRESTFNLHGTSASKAVMEAFEEQYGEPSKTSKGKQLSSFLEGLCSPLRDMVDFSMLTNPVFLLLGTANMIGMLGFYTPFVYLPEAAIEKGVDKDSATFLVSIIGITNTVGRILSGFFADLPWVNALWLNNVSILLSGLCVFLTPFASSYGAFVAIAVFFGFFVSAYISLTSVILVELIGLEMLTSAFGLLILFRGSACLVGPPLAGSIYDATNSYDVSFYSAGALLFVCAFLHCIIPCAQRFCYCVDSPVRYHTNEEYLEAIPEEELDECGGRPGSPDGGEGAGIMFDIKPKMMRGERSFDRVSVSSSSSRERIGCGVRRESSGAAL